MPAIYEEFIRCEKCGHPEFKEEKRYTFHYKLRERADKTQPLTALETEIAYVCANPECAHPLNK